VSPVADLHQELDAAARQPPILCGRLAGHEQARAFADQVRRCLQRYAKEVVFEHGLCPFLKDVDTGFGAFIVVLDDELDAEVGARAILEADTTVLHVVYPLVSLDSGPFERFGSELNNALKGRVDELPVHATFHPQMVGARDDPNRLVGLLRQSPDPFVQFIPGGLHGGGTVYAGMEEPTVPNVERIFGKITGEVADGLFAKMDEIRADRVRSYRPFLDAFGIEPAPWGLA